MHVVTFERAWPGILSSIRNTAKQTSKRKQHRRTANTAAWPSPIHGKVRWAIQQREQREDRREVKTIRVFRLSEHPTPSPLLSATAKFLLEELKLLDKCYLTKTCTASKERNETPAVSLSHKWGSGGAEGSAGFRNDYILIELLTGT